MRKSPQFFILILNIMVYVSWNLASTEADFLFMVKNFLVSWDSVFGGYPWTLLTSVFSHSSFMHFLFNMMALMSFSTVMVTLLGPKQFTTFYLMAGLAGSISHILTSNYLMHDPSMKALGASGAVAGIILLFSLLFPTQKLLIMGLIPIRAIWGAVFLVALDVWGLVTQTNGGGFQIGHGAHLGGALVGILYFLSIRKRIQ